MFTAADIRLFTLTHETLDRCANWVEDCCSVAATSGEGRDNTSAESRCCTAVANRRGITTHAHDRGDWLLRVFT